MSFAQFIEELTAQGVTLQAEGGTLLIHRADAVLRPEVEEFLREFADEILLWMETSDAASVVQPVIVPAPQDRHAPFPLTDIQHAYWVGRNGALALGDVSTHVYLELGCTDLDLTRLQTAWQQVIARHEMMRALVTPSGEQQIRSTAAPYSIPICDLRGQSAEAVLAQTLHLREEMSHQVLPDDFPTMFDIRAMLLDDGRTRLHIGIDVLFYDMASVFMILEEWRTRYLDPGVKLPALTLSFRDCVLADQLRTSSPVYQQSRAYWLGRLASLPPAPKLPLRIRPESAGPTRFVRRTHRFEESLWQALKLRTSQSGLTPNALLLAAYAQVLGTWSEKQHFTINVTLFSRPPVHPQINEIVGDFTLINLLEVDQSISETFVQRAGRIQKQLWEDMDHRSFSGVQVIRELLQRSGSRAEGPLMPVVFTSGLGHGTGVGFRPFGELLYEISQAPQVFIDLVVIEESGQLVISWNAVEALFPEAVIEDMFSSYCRLLHGLATTKEEWNRCSHTLVPDHQLAQRESVNATAVPIADALLHELFATQAQAFGDRPAVITSERTLSYAELYQRANELAHQLRQLGARPGMLVAVVMEKGWEQLVAVQAILMAGAAYLPIDPGLPAERQSYLLDQGEVTIALIQSRLQAKLLALGPLTKISVDLAGVGVTPLPPLASIQKPTDLAYVIYTSGSTGLPKGVMIDHRGAVNTILDINRRFAVSEQDRVLALSALNFDLSVYDIFGLLAVGGAVVLPDADRPKDPAHWAAQMAEHRVTLWNTVPALMQLMVEYLQESPARVPDGLRTVLLSGDWIPLKLPEQVRAVWSVAPEIVSLGGATEASIWSIYHRIANIDPSWKSIPYGKPLSNQSFHVLDPHLRPRPVWTTGELFIGGVGLAQGYWKDRQKTEERFVETPLPTGGERGLECCRLYRTGDLGRYLPDGSIEFLGREDFQVKVSGYRIELGEIEHQLSQHPAVQQAVVSTVGEARGQKQLVAYVVPRSQDTDAAKTPGPSQRADGLLTHPNAQGASVLQDPVERLEFKLKQHALRSIPGATVIELGAGPVDEERRKTYLARQSYRQFQQAPIARADFCGLLSLLSPISLPESPLPKYLYPSAGSLYPVQTYVQIRASRIEGLAPGFYYYQPVARQLIWLSAGDAMNAALHAPANRPAVESSAFAIYLVGQLAAIAPLYGNLARDFCLLEAGYIGQLLMEHAPGLHLGLCPIGEFDEESLFSALQLTGDQILLHSFVGGGISDVQQAAWGVELVQSVGRSQDPVKLVAELREYLGSRLPDYMVPTHFMMLERLPLTSNGKVDRSLLPRVQDSGALSAKTVLPESEVERLICEIVGQTLHLSKCGVTTNFFDLGASSLHIVQIFNKLPDAMKARLSITDMFRLPTIRALAEQLGAQSLTPSKAASAVVDQTQQHQDRGKARRLARSRT